MKHILSLQSHVTYGYAGNKAAVFAMQRIGVEVSNINLLQFSNHTGYGQWEGAIYPPEHINALLTGINNQQISSTFDGVVTGYLTRTILDSNFISFLDDLKDKNPNLIYCCDPVIGDIGFGMYVDKAVPGYLIHECLPRAMIATPNQFEIEFLTGIKINTLEDAIRACEHLSLMGPEIVLLTSLERKSSQSLEIIAYTKKQVWRIETPKLRLASTVSGTGDIIAGIFLAKYLGSKNIKISLEHAVNVVYSILKITSQNQCTELALIKGQDNIVKPNATFCAKEFSECVEEFG